MDNKELWVNAPDFPDYEVSNWGRVRSKDREVRQFGHKSYFTRIMKGRIIKPKPQNGGYLIVWLRKDNKSKAVSVHRLIATAFYGPSENDVNHKDGNKENNHISNLEWVTRADNIKHAYNTLKRRKGRISVMCIETGQVFASMRKASIAMNTNPISIRHNLLGCSKTAGGYTWKMCN